MFHSFRDWKANKCLILSTAAGIDEKFYRGKETLRERERDREQREGGRKLQSIIFLSLLISILSRMQVDEEN